MPNAFFKKPWKWGRKPNLSRVVLCKSSHGGGVGPRILSQAGGDLDHISGALLRDHHRVVERCGEILLRLQCERWALRLEDTHRDPAWFETPFLLECGWWTGCTTSLTCVWAVFFSLSSVCCWDRGWAGCGCCMLFCRGPVDTTWLCMPSVPPCGTADIWTELRFTSSAPFCRNIWNQQCSVWAPLRCGRAKHLARQ